MCEKDENFEDKNKVNDSFNVTEAPKNIPENENGNLKIIME
jgi:hypothetical protein